MATKLDVVPADNAAHVEGVSTEKQPDIAPAVESSEKKVEDTTQGLNDLPLVDEKSAPASEEEASQTAAAPTVATTTAPPAPPSTETTAPTTDTVQSGPVWPNTAPEHALTKFYDAFDDLVKESQHDEVYGIHLSKSSPFHTKLILQKFLRANQNDLDKAKQQLLETLKWRKEFDPVKAASESFNKTRFGGLGYVLEVEGVPESKNAKDIVTFNIYGAVKDKKATFGDLEGYVCLRPSHVQTGKIVL
jgi:hypothetical protein